MSSTVATTEVQTLSKEDLSVSAKMEENKSQRLVRTSSLEKIRRFNTYICSQQYYIIPALLAYLKSSQSSLQTSVEKTIFFFRSLIFTTFLYKKCQIELKRILNDVIILTCKQTLNSYRVMNLLLRIAAYLIASILLSQLVVCCYLLTSTYIPSGLIFLIVCWLYINYLNYKSLSFFVEKQKFVEYNPK